MAEDHALDVLPGRRWEASVHPEGTVTGTGIVCSVSVSVLLIGTQKLDPSGRPTMSAHPGECFLL